MYLVRIPDQTRTMQVYEITDMEWRGQVTSLGRPILEPRRPKAWRYGARPAGGNAVGGYGWAAIGGNYASAVRMALSASVEAA